MKSKSVNKIKWHKKLSAANWLTIIGGLIIFGSWLVEKNNQAKWTDEKEKLKRSQLVIDITEGTRSTFEVAYYSEARKNLIDTFQIAFLQQRLARTYLDLLTWSKGRVTDNSDEYSKLIDSKRQIDEENLACLGSGDYKKINSNFNLVAAVFGKKYMQLDKEFSDKYDLVQDNEEWWTIFFTFLYILGSCLLGLSFIVEKIKTKDK